MLHLTGQLSGAEKHSVIYRNIDMSTILIKDLLQGLVAQLPFGFAVSPDQDAYNFYLWDDVFMKLNQKFPYGVKLPDKYSALAREAYNYKVKSCHRALLYNLVIITREARHFKTSPALKCGTKTSLAIVKKFVHTIQDSSSEGNVKAWISDLPNMDVKTFIDCLVTIFEKGVFNGGFGGYKWAEIAKNVQRFVSGQVNMLIMADTAYTLSHNNGPIFNKGMWYTQYTGMFLSLLDVQRSGQIPKLLFDKSPYMFSFRSTCINYNYISPYDSILQELYEFNSNVHVDWQVIMAIGVDKGEASSMYANQVELYGATNKPAFEGMTVKGFIRIDHLNKIAYGERAA